MKKKIAGGSVKPQITFRKKKWDQRDMQQQQHMTNMGMTETVPVILLEMSVIVFF